jgi:hypothetical protein
MNCRTYLPDVVRSTCGFDNLLEDVSVASSSLVVDRDDGILFAEIATGAHQSIETVLHLGVAALHRVEVQVGVLRALDARGRSTATDPDPVGWTADLHDEHPLFRGALIRVPAVKLPDPGGEHDRFHPFEALPARKSLTERPREAMDDRLAVLVSVVGRSVARLDLDVQGGGEVPGVHEGLVLPRKVVPRDVQITDAVRRHARHGVGAPPRRHHVTEPPAGSRLGAGKGRDAGGEVVRLGGKDGVQRFLGDADGTGLGNARRVERVALISTDRGGVVVEGDDRVVGDILRERRFDHLKEGERLFFPINDHLSAKEPVS